MSPDIWVDFNNLNSDYETAGILLDTDGLYFKGSSVTVGDDEGNSAEAIITRVSRNNEGTVTFVKVDITTFRGSL